MTLAPRIQVYTDIACRAVQEPLSHLSDECTSLPEVQQGAASLQACAYASQLPAVHAY